MGPAWGEQEALAPPGDGSGGPPPCFINIRDITLEVDWEPEDWRVDRARPDRSTGEVKTTTTQFDDGSSDSLLRTSLIHATAIEITGDVLRADGSSDRFRLQQPLVGNPIPGARFDHSHPGPGNALTPDTDAPPPYFNHKTSSSGTRTAVDLARELNRIEHVLRAGHAPGQSPVIGVRVDHNNLQEGFFMIVFGGIVGYCRTAGKTETGRDDLFERALVFPGFPRSVFFPEGGFKLFP
jgi:hypothetical protein